MGEGITNNNNEDNVIEWSPQEIKRMLDKAVSGQNEAKETLSILGFNHLMRYYRLENPYGEELPETPRFVCLLSGPTGTGKTLLVKELAHVLNLPFIHLDATRISPPGWQGKSIMDMLANFEKNHPDAGFNDYAVVFIDEVDKLTGKSDTQVKGYNDEKQTALLTVMEGADIQLKYCERKVLKTHNMLFILAGAFEHVYRVRGRKEIGFKGDINPNVTNDCLSDDELETSGMLRELIGRINVKTHTRPLELADIYNALTILENNILSYYENLLGSCGEPDYMSTEEVLEVAKTLKDSKYGMRYADTLIFSKLKDKLFSLKFRPAIPSEDLQALEHLDEYPIPENDEELPTQDGK